MEEMIHEPESRQPFQTCGSCNQRWTDWKHFLLDARVRFLGLQASPQLSAANLLVFEHRCGSSISILASRLRHLLPVAADEEENRRLYGSEMCREHCNHLEDLEVCDRPCTNAYDRRLVQLLVKMKQSEVSRS